MRKQDRKMEKLQGELFAPLSLREHGGLVRGAGDTWRGTGFSYQNGQLVDALNDIVPDGGGGVDG